MKRLSGYRAARVSKRHRCLLPLPHGHGSVISHRMVEGAGVGKAEGTGHAPEIPRETDNSRPDPNFFQFFL
jgi:hypothetical protein